jgi:hypothetical protein
MLLSFCGVKTTYITTTLKQFLGNDLNEKKRQKNSFMNMAQTLEKKEKEMFRYF